MRAPSAARHRAATTIAALLGLGGIAIVLNRGGAIGWPLAGFLALAVRFASAPRPRELTRLGALLAALAILVALAVGGAFVAMESGEVVRLRYRDGGGRQHEDRLWVIDLAGAPSVTTGSDTRRAAWIRANPQVELVRRGRAECRLAVVVPAESASEEERALATRLYREKYGRRIEVSRALRALLGGPGAEPVLIRLEPCGHP